MRRKVPVISIGKGYPDVASKVLLVDGPSALELNFPYVSRATFSILAAQDEIDPIVVDGKEGVVSALHGQGYQPLAIDDLNHLA